jgi:hypothetical protein
VSAGWSSARGGRGGGESIGNEGKGAALCSAITECQSNASLLVMYHAPLPLPLSGGWARAFRLASIEPTHASTRDLPLISTPDRNLRVNKFKPLIPKCRNA